MIIDICIPPGGIRSRTAHFLSFHFSTFQEEFAAARLSQSFVPRKGAADGQDPQADGKHYFHPRSYSITGKWDLLLLYEQKSSFYFQFLSHRIFDSSITRAHTVPPKIVQQQTYIL